MLFSCHLICRSHFHSFIRWELCCCSWCSTWYVVDCSDYLAAYWVSPREQWSLNYIDYILHVRDTLADDKNTCGEENCFGSEFPPFVDNAAFLVFKCSFIGQEMPQVIIVIMQFYSKKSVYQKDSHKNVFHIWSWSRFLKKKKNHKTSFFVWM